MKKFLFVFMVCLFVSNVNVALAEDKIQSIATQTNVLKYALNSTTGVKIVLINPEGSALIQGSKNEVEFKQFLLNNLEDLPSKSNVLILSQKDGYCKITITGYDQRATVVGKNFSEALRSLRYKLGLDL